MIIHTSQSCHIEDRCAHFILLLSAPEEARFPDTETDSTGRSSAWIDFLRKQQGSSGRGDTPVR